MPSLHFGSEGSGLAAIPRAEHAGGVRESLAHDSGFVHVLHLTPDPFPLREEVKTYGVRLVVAVPVAMTGLAGCWIK